MLFYDLFRHDPEFVSIKNGDCLFKEGEVGKEMYVLISGIAEITLKGIILEECTQGAIVGEMAVIDGSPRSATVTAKTDCSFAIIDAHRFHFLVDETPGFALNVMSAMSQRLKACDQRIIKSETT
jgi:CRP-like cAMP-binding protein